MNREERITLISDLLNDLANEGEAGESFVIFENSETMKFVQFAFVEGGLMLDIPLVELSKEEANGIRAILGEEGAKDARTGKLTSYQRLFGFDEIGKATELVEMIFLGVFKFGGSYTINPEINI